MNRLSFGLVLHFHQPVGNFEEVFERTYQRCYKPFFELLSSYPEVSMTIHLSGSLLDYLEEKHPDIIDFVKILASRGQIELMGGPYYEPILTAIPENDAIGQLNMMSEYIKSRFGFRPNGAWIPERVWEPRVAKLLAQSGIRYCTLDDTLLMKANVAREDIGGYVTTGSPARKIAVFPCDKKLRYLMPFKMPQKTIGYLKSIASKKEDFLLLYADDAEKFGEWSGTHDLVYRREWLKNFFDMLTANSDWIELVKLSDYLKSHGPVASLKIPEGAYDEMTSWAGGSWKRFLSKYPESNQMQKKALYVSSKIEKIKKDSNKENKEKIDEARRELYKGQCNCPYWHGMYGGLYFYHLRSAVYKHLITAEKIMDDILYGDTERDVELKQLDYSPGGTREFLIEGKDISLYFDPADGGVLRELDYKPLAANLINTLSRKKEPYHKIPHPVDKHGRYCLREHFITRKLRRIEFVKSIHEEYGNIDIGNCKAKKTGNKLILEQRSKIDGSEFALMKEVELVNDKHIVVTYLIKLIHSNGVDVDFGVEFNVTMPELNAKRYSYACNNASCDNLSASGTSVEANSFGIHDSENELNLSFGFSKPARGVWYFPVKTISQSERKYNRDYQASCIMPRWKLDFKRNKEWALKIKWSLA